MGRWINEAPRYELPDDPEPHEVTVVITEMLCRDVTVIARDSWEAEEKAWEMYDKGEIVLSADDYAETSIDALTD